MRKLISVVLVILLVTALTGCAVVGDIAGNVADAAAKELENQLKATLEKHKVEVVEVKTAFGNLNSNDDMALQFFGAALIQSDSDTAAENCAKALDAVFEEAGFMTQTGSAIEVKYLVHKTLSYDHTDFSEGNYYTVYVYSYVYNSKT